MTMVIKIGTFGNDLLVGSSGADSLQGSFGDDTLRGLAGNDVRSGGGDDDTLEGGAGNDSLFGDAGVDTVLMVTAADVAVNLEWGFANSASLGNDTLALIENVTTGDGADVIVGSDLANVLKAGAGADNVFAGAGDDTIYGGNNADLLGGGQGNDTLFGGNGADFLNGEEDDDEVDGGAGNDEIWGGYGVDHLTGGTGADTFVFTSWDTGVGAGNRDIVEDFGKADGDKIDLHFFDDLQFIGTETFSAPDQVRFFQSNGDTIFRINTLGNTDAEFEIKLEGTVNLAAGDFLL
jgi:Ca2+-binding RTX toxin-like protein